MRENTRKGAFRISHCGAWAAACDLTPSRACWTECRSCFSAEKRKLSIAEGQVGSADIGVSTDATTWLEFLYKERSLRWMLGRERLRMRDVLPLYHGIHCERFAVNERTFSKDRATVLCTRWFEPIYDNLTIVRAFAAVQERVPGIRMVFAASGSQVAEAKNLWRTLRSPGLPERMSFLGGVGRSELLRELNAADIYVSMSLSDGTSTALLEALSAGLFPILSDIPANREWLETHACKGILVPIGDAKALEQALVQATGDPRRRREASVHNLAVVRELADADTNLRILLAKLSAAARDNSRLTHSDKG
jgi:glycosyltransferase involved in cell wall biosynthesis